MALPVVRSTNSASGVPLGSVTPRLWTPPLASELTPETSYGYDVIAFAEEVLGTPLDEWQKWLVVHGGELLPDGRPRFRQLLALVSRQCGKTFLLQVLTNYWLFVEQQSQVLGMSTSRDRAKEAWKAVVDAAQANPLLSAEIPPRGVRLQINEEELKTTHGSSYRFAATNRRAGRGMSIDRLIVDEIREHRDFTAWDACVPAMNARPAAQLWAISNQGDEGAVVLDSLREPAVEFIETGRGDSRLGLFEWSAPPGCEPDDPEAIAQACPAFGRRIDPDAILGQATRAKRAGGEELSGWRTEILVQRVHLLDPAIDPDLWDRAGTDAPIDLAQHRDKVALCLDVSLDGTHATLTAAAVVDERVHLDVVRAWDGVDQLRRELPGIIAKVRPRVLAWYPAGPAAAVAADLRTAKWPRGTQLEAIKGDVVAVCMGLAEQVQAGKVVHSKDPLQDQHIRNAQRLKRGDAWLFGRRGSGAIDGAYSAAGAVHLARTLPPPKPALAVV